MVEGQMENSQNFYFHLGIIQLPIIENGNFYARYD